MPPLPLPSRSSAQHMDSPSLLAIFPLQDLLPLSSRLPDVAPAEQQINEPSNPQHYWR